MEYVYVVFRVTKYEPVAIAAFADEDAAHEYCVDRNADAHRNRYYTVEAVEYLA